MSALPLPQSSSQTASGLTAIGLDLLAREELVLRRVIRRYVRDDATADDLYQEVSLKVLRRIETVRDQATMRGWLFQLARNTCLDYLRAQDRRPTQSSVDRGEVVRGPNPVDRLCSHERVAAVHQALAELPASQREVIRLRIEEGLDHVGIAERLGISRQAVEVRLCRGRAALKERLLDILEGDL